MSKTPESFTPELHEFSDNNSVGLSNFNKGDIYGTLGRVVDKKTIICYDGDPKNCSICTIKDCSFNTSTKK